jgi:cyclopropane fatty-acyl-phospholipid synthase-like methyltransferase
LSRPHQDEQAYHAHFYEHDANRILCSAIFAELIRKEYRFLSRHILQAPHDRLLSLASGEGRLEAQLAPQVGHILGIEICEAAVKKARARAEAATLTNLVFQVGDIRNLEMPPNSFDAVLALGVLHHLSESSIKNILRKSRSWLKPGGVFLSIDPSSRRLVKVLKWLVAKTYEKYHSPDERELKVEKVFDTFRQMGFSRITLHYIDFFLHPLAWLVPEFPKIFMPLAMALDSWLCAAPYVRRFASGFAVVAHRPLSS